MALAVLVGVLCCGAGRGGDPTLTAGRAYCPEPRRASDVTSTRRQRPVAAEQGAGSRLAAMSPAGAWSTWEDTLVAIAGARMGKTTSIWLYPKSWTHPARGIGPTYTAATRPERVSDVSTLAALPSSRAVVMPSGTYPLVVRKLTWHQVKAHREATM